MKLRNIFLPVALLLFGLLVYILIKREKTEMAFTGAVSTSNDRTAAAALSNVAKAAAAFTNANGMEQRFCFLIDMQLRSGKKRFFVYDFNQKQVVAAGTVAHGRCNEDWLKGRRYSNVPGCGCTSLGRYRIGASYYGRFGLAYKLHGLDTSNSNAFRRFVVLHAHACVPDEERFTEICQSDGCPTVAPAFLQQLKQYLDRATAPVLLWIYHS